MHLKSPSKENSTWTTEKRAYHIYSEDVLLYSTSWIHKHSRITKAKTDSQSQITKTQVEVTWSHNFIFSISHISCGCFLHLWWSHNSFQSQPNPTGKTPMQPCGRSKTSPSRSSRGKKTWHTLRMFTNKYTSYKTSPPFSSSLSILDKTTLLHQCVSLSLSCRPPKNETLKHTIEASCKH